MLQPRWIALTLVVALLVVVFTQLAGWQLRRLDERRAANAVITRNSERPARPAEAVLAPGRPVAAAAEWQPLTARGTYDRGHEVLVRYRAFDGEPGFHVLTPLVTGQGPALLVDRGWIPAAGRATRSPDVPAPRTGEVTVTGRLRQSEAGEAAQVRPTAGQVRFVDSAAIAATTPYPVYGGYVELVTQKPAAGDTPRAIPLPDQSEGPHLSYAVQWYLFAVIAVAGWAFLTVDDAKGGRLRERIRVPARSEPA